MEFPCVTRAAPQNIGSGGPQAVTLTRVTSSPHSPPLLGFSALKCLLTRGDSTSSPCAHVSLSGGHPRTPGVSSWGQKSSAVRKNWADGVVATATGWGPRSCCGLSRQPAENSVPDERAKLSAAAALVFLPLSVCGPDRGGWRSSSSGLCLPAPRAVFQGPSSASFRSWFLVEADSQACRVRRGLRSHGVRQSPCRQPHGGA